MPTTGEPVLPASHLQNQRQQTSQAGTIWLRVLLHYMVLTRWSNLVWILGLGLTGGLVVATYETAFPSMQERLLLSAQIEGNPAYEAMFGKAVALATLEGFTMWRAVGPLAPIAAVWGVMMVSRLTRGEEDEGRNELLLSGIVRTPMLVQSVLLLLYIGVALLLTLATVVLTIAGLDPAPALRAAGAIAGMSLVFGTVTALVAQIMPTRSRTTLVAGGLTGVMLATRVLAASSGTPEWLWWMTPLGWPSMIGVGPGVNLLPYALMLIVAAAASAGAVVLAGKREYQAGLVASRESTSHGMPIRSLWSLNLLLTWPATVGWGVAIAGFAFVFGLMSSDVVDVFSSSPSFVEIMRQLGFPDPTGPEFFLGVSVLLFILPLSLFAVGRISNMRDDEGSGRLDTLLVRPVSRARWLLTGIATTTLGVVTIAFAAGITAWLGTTLSGATMGIDSALSMGVGMMPVALLFMGLATLLFGVLPRLVGMIAYLAVLLTYLLDFIAAFFDMPAWVVMLSPYHHVPLVPAEDPDPVSSLVMIALGLAGVLIGLWAFRRRDIQGF